MKKTLLLLILVISLSLTSCSLGDLLSSKQTRDASFTANYDYGFHMEGRAALLLSGSTVFFEPSEWDIGTILAGDVITMTYRGRELMVQESYPSRVVTDGVEIISITQTKAKVMKLTATKTPDGKIAMKGENISVALAFPEAEEHYVISSDMTFRVLDKSFDGRTLYATYTQKGNVAEIHAIYDYLPRS